MRFSDASRRGLAAALLLAATACAPVLPTRLYTIAPSEPPAGEAGGGPALGLGPVNLPDYLDRAEIVTRAGEHGVRLGELDKWAEPLEPMVLRLLAEGLRRETGSRDVVLLPSRREVEPPVAVEVDVDRFDAGEGGEVVLDARWRVRRAEDDRTLGTGRSLIREPGTAVPDYAGIVAAMSRAVGRLAGEIGAAVPKARARPAAATPASARS